MKYIWLHNHLESEYEIDSMGTETMWCLPYLHQSDPMIPYYCKNTRMFLCGTGHVFLHNAHSVFTVLPLSIRTCLVLTSDWLGVIAWHSPPFTQPLHPSLLHFSIVCTSVATISPSDPMLTCGCTLHNKDAEKSAQGWLKLLLHFMFDPSSP